MKIKDITDEPKSTNNKKVNYGQKMPFYLKLNLVFSIVALVGMVFMITAGVLIAKDVHEDQGTDKSILYTSIVFFGVGYLFGIIYSAILWKLYPDATKQIGSLKLHYILNFIPATNCFVFITAIIILRHHDYDLV